MRKANDAGLGDQAEDAVGTDKSRRMSCRSAKLAARLSYLSASRLKKNFGKCET